MWLEYTTTQGEEGGGGKGSGGALGVTSNAWKGDKWGWTDMGRHRVGAVMSENGCAIKLYAANLSLYGNNASVFVFHITAC